MNINSTKLLADADGPPWRWTLAERIIRGETVTDNTDEYVVQAVAMQRVLDEHQPATVGPEVDAPSHFVKVAHEIYHQNGIPRWHIEACAVTGLRDGEIERRCRVPREVVNTYIKVFFDVRPQLPPGDWIHHYVLGDVPFRGCREGDVRVLWAWMGSSGGPQLLTMLVDSFLAALRPGDRPVLSVYFRPTVPLPVQVTTAFGVLGMSPESAATVERYRSRFDRASRLSAKKERREIKRAANELIQIARAKLKRNQFAEDAAQPRGPYQRTPECPCRYHHYGSTNQS